MITIIRDVDTYAPKYLGKKQILIMGDRFYGIYDKLDVPKEFMNIKISEVDGSNKVIFPGFIDNHVHVIGGGGEAGFFSRTREIEFTELTTAGITTVIGTLGTDNVCRDMKSLIAKVGALNEEGITAYCYTGSYDIPVKTVTGSIKEDLMLIDKVIGVGEIAISDNRSSQPTYEQFVSCIAQARTGGLLSGKSGVVNIHVGDGKRKLEKIFKLLDNTEIPPSQLLPTHINRNSELFEAGIEYIKKGGYIDLTTSSNADYLEPEELLASEALKRIVELKLPIERVTFSSDGQGSMPLFDENKNLKAIDVCSVKTLYDSVKMAIEKGVSIEDAISVITINPAKIFKLKDVGQIKENYKADFVLVNKDNLEITDVYAKGKPLIRDNKIVVKGIFK